MQELENVVMLKNIQLNGSFITFMSICISLGSHILGFHDMHFAVSIACLLKAFLEL